MIGFHLISCEGWIYYPLSHFPFFCTAYWQEECLLCHHLLATWNITDKASHYVTYFSHIQQLNFKTAMPAQNVPRNNIPEHTSKHGYSFLTPNFLQGNKILTVLGQQYMPNNYSPSKHIIMSGVLMSVFQCWVDSQQLLFPYQRLIYTTSDHISPDKPTQYVANGQQKQHSPKDHKEVWCWWCAIECSNNLSICIYYTLPVAVTVKLFHNQLLESRMQQPIANWQRCHKKVTTMPSLWKVDWRT